MLSLASSLCDQCIKEEKSSPSLSTIVSLFHDHSLWSQVISSSSQSSSSTAQATASSSSSSKDLRAWLSRLQSLLSLPSKHSKVPLWMSNRLWCGAQLVELLASSASLDKDTARLCAARLAERLLTVYARELGSEQVQLSSVRALSALLHSQPHQGKSRSLPVFNNQLVSRIIDQFITKLEQATRPGASTRLMNAILSCYTMFLASWRSLAASAESLQRLEKPLLALLIDAKTSAASARLLSELCVYAGPNSNSFFAIQDAPEVAQVAGSSAAARLTFLLIHQAHLIIDHAIAFAGNSISGASDQDNESDSAARLAISRVPDDDFAPLRLPSTGPAGSKLPHDYPEPMISQCSSRLACFTDSLFTVAQFAPGFPVQGALQLIARSVNIAQALILHQQEQEAKANHQRLPSPPLSSLFLIWRELLSTSLRFFRRLLRQLRSHLFANSSLIIAITQRCLALSVSQVEIVDRSLALQVFTALLEIGGNGLPRDSFVVPAVRRHLIEMWKKNSESSALLSVALQALGAACRCAGLLLISSVQDRRLRFDIEQLLVSLTFRVTRLVGNNSNDNERLQLAFIEAIHSTLVAFAGTGRSTLLPLACDCLSSLSRGASSEGVREKARSVLFAVTVFQRPTVPPIVNAVHIMDEERLVQELGRERGEKEASYFADRNEKHAEESTNALPPTTTTSNKRSHSREEKAEPNAEERESATSHSEPSESRTEDKNEVVKKNFEEVQPYFIPMQVKEPEASLDDARQQQERKKHKKEGKFKESDDEDEAKEKSYDLSSEDDEIPEIVFEPPDE